MSILRKLCLAASLSLISSPLVAQEEDLNPDPVFVFNRICYSQVHDIPAIQEMALELAWRSVADDKIKEFSTSENPKVLQGWDLKIGERLFRVVVNQADVTNKMKASFPNFADGKATSCTLLMDDRQDPAEFIPNMESLAGKAPISEDVDDGPYKTTTWAGGNEDIKVFLFAKALKTGSGGYLSTLILQK